MLWRMSADLRQQGIGMTFINIDASTTRSVGGQMTGGKGGKGGNPFPSPYSGTQEFPVAAARTRAISCRIPAGSGQSRDRRRMKSASANGANPLAGLARPNRRRAMSARGRRDALRPDALALGIDLAQHHQHLLGDDVARDALALGLELLHVDPHRIERRRALCDDAGMQEGLDQHAEDIVAFLELGAAVVVAEDLLDRIAHPLPFEPIFGVDDLL